jgi:hypothetical protein
VSVPWNVPFSGLRSPASVPLIDPQKYELDVAGHIAFGSGLVLYPPLTV